MTRRVLVIDDSELSRQLVRNALGRDFEIEEAANGHSAAALARTFAPDLVLQDLVLPDVDGFELLDQLRAIVGRQVPILAFKGILSTRAEARLGTSAFDDIISKPVDAARVLQIVRGYFPDDMSASGTFGRERRVVLVDDDPVQRKLAAFRLTRLGFDVVPAGDGVEALAIALANPPDVIVSDVLMPRMDGFELCSRVRAEEKLASVPVVLLTNSYLEQADFELARRVGAEGYLVRTPDLQELTAVLERTFRQPAVRPMPVAPVVPDVQGDRIERALRQLDRQVAMNAALQQRNTILSAELAILGGLTGALAEHRDPDLALNTALAACLDAGGIAWGAVLVRDDAGWGPARVIGVESRFHGDVGRALEGAAANVTASRRASSPSRLTVAALGELGIGADVLAATLTHGDDLLGVLFLGAGDSLDEHRLSFAGVVAGQIALTLALGRTIRAYERATQAERERVRLLKSVLDAIEDPIIVLDPSHHATHWNKAAERLDFASHAGDIVGWMRAADLVEPDQRTPLSVERLPIVRALHGESVTRQEIVSLGRASTPTWLSINARPVQSEAGGVESAVAVIRDVTQDKLAQAHQLFSDRMASVGTLAAGVAHEINNPLTAVIAGIDLAFDEIDSSAKDALMLARDAADRVRLIVRDLKTLSRGETDDVALVDLSKIVESAARLAGAEVRARASVVRELSEVPPVRANEARLGQVFLNLMVNAAHAIEAGQPDQNRITVRTRVEGGDVVAEVIDTGAGMSPEVKSRIFTPFFTTKPVGIGSGLGLSVSDGIVRAAGGTMEVESEPGRGSTFRVRLPIARIRESYRTGPIG